MNPFITSGYVSPEYFCDREKESKRLINAIENNSNVTLFSVRRMGKTGLIKHVFQLFGKRNSNLVYVDIAHTASLNDLINLLSNAILKKFQSKPAKFLKELTNMFRSLRPVMKFDEKTGEPQVSVSFVTSHDAQNSLENIFDYLKTRAENRKICIAIDEFQQITKYPEKNVEALLRSHIQNVPLISFIFSGSKNNIMRNMFFDAKRPFYQSTEPMNLENINEETYSEFIREKFENEGILIENNTVTAILEWTRAHTFYVQYVCYKLYSDSLKKISIEDFNRVSDQLLEENESIFLGYENILTKSEFSLLSAIAKEGKVNKPTAIDFIKKYSLSGASSVNYVLKKLVDTDMVFEEKGAYYVYDVFFSRWLERL